MCQSSARGTFCGNEEGYLSCSNSLSLPHAWLLLPYLHFASCIFRVQRARQQKRPELNLNVQKAFQRCQHMTTVIIVKMHIPPLSGMTKPSPACSEGSPFSAWLSQVAVQSAAALLDLLTETSPSTSDSCIFMLAE